MKLRALSFNKTLLRKDIFRFAPLWAIYFIGGLLVMMTSLVGLGAHAASVLNETMGPFAVINMIYAALVAQMLFGDLFNSRLCNALHALPMRRETWFATHITAGIAYSVVPHLVAAIFFLPRLEVFGWVAFVWVAVMLMEYLFFFGLAVFCVMCTGNRFAQVAVYAILNFLSMIVHWFVSVIYQPLLYGVQIGEEGFVTFCPVAKMSSFYELLRFEWVVEYNTLGILQSEGHYVYMGAGEGWGYLGICAGIGVAFLVAALFLYRKRKLECAGEFVAFQQLKPVVSVVFALCIGAVVSAFGQSFVANNAYLVFLIIGLVVGWFGGQMLLQRTVRVFKTKAFVNLVVLGLALLLTVGLTAWDPVGITRYVPDEDSIQRIEFAQGTLYAYSGADVDTKNAENFPEIIQIHKKILEDRGQCTGAYRTVSIRYTLKSGQKITRTYQVYTESSAWMKIQNLLNRPAYLLGETDWNAWYKSINQAYFNGHTVKDLVMNFNELKKDEQALPLSAYTVENELLRAVFEDAKAGNLMNQQAYDKEICQYHVSIQRTKDDGTRVHMEVYIPLRAEKCQEWIKKYGEVLSAYGVH